MQSPAPTVDAYLAALPDERRKALQAVRAVILANLDPDYEEGMQYGMIGYYVPHRVHPAGYHCDPKQPLPFAGLGAQKHHLALYLMCVYGDEGLRTWFEAAWKASGKKLDMGKSCVRFRGLEDVPLEVVGEAIRKVPAKTYVAKVQELLARPREPRPKAARTASKPAGKAAPKR
ncbi:MAG: DUF1801 domain-containing protein [Holophagaceae bacterium]